MRVFNCIIDIDRKDNSIQIAHGQNSPADRKKK